MKYTNGMVILTRFCKFVVGIIFVSLAFNYYTLTSSAQHHQGVLGRVFRGAASNDQGNRKLYEEKSYNVNDVEPFSEEEAANDDVARLMRKDYGKEKPHKKPPINNHKPID